MSVLPYLERWLATGAITGEQYADIRELTRKERLSVCLELNALLYLGVVAFVGGIGWTVRVHFARLGDAAILIPLTMLLAGCFYYCFARAPAYSPKEVAPPSFAFDYVLYLACLVFAVELGYVEFRFHLLRSQWDHYLLVSALAYFALAYRFDNRLVLSLALATLGGWFGVRVAHLGFFVGDIRACALAYGGILALGGLWLERLGIKRHFVETYLHIATNVVLWALVSGVVAADLARARLWVLGLLGASGVAIVGGVRFRRFSFVVYGVVYGYLGLSDQLLRTIDSFTAGLAYVAVSSTIVIASLVVVARRFGRET
jgi:hypothetical protein